MSTKTVVVAGDVMIDWHMSVDREKIVAARSWADAGKVRRVPQFGGAWLLEDLIRKMAADSGYTIGGIKRPPVKSYAKAHYTYTILTPSNDDVLRVHEFLGVEASPGLRRLKIDRDDARADVVSLLDSDFEFDRTEASWPKAIKTAGHKPWIVLKTSIPDFQQKLWQHLMKEHADKLIVVMTVEDLRRKEIKLIRRLSWERAAQDLVRELKNSPALQALRYCRHLVVSFGPAGAMLLSHDAAPRLVFDAAAMEQEWQPDKRPSGRMIGYTSVLAAAITHEVMIHLDSPPQIADALPRGLARMRALLEHGFGKDKENPRLDLDAIANAKLQGDTKKRIATTVVDTDKSWSVLKQRLDRLARNIPDGKLGDALYETAARVAILGPEAALVDVPQLKIGNLFTVDRGEIEALRSVKTLLTEYVASAQSEPWSIAVFGAPGSGKSFAVKEIAQAIDPKKIRAITFNLTQFARAEDLRGAFHQVRDIALRGEIPLVFWDEFDTTFETTPFGWLRYFISPMQDGSFQEDQITHPIGKSIFVFAGGTAKTHQEFVTEAFKEENKQRKAPDFISRLKGYLDVTGPNPREGGADPYFVIRRAILLRSILSRRCPDLLRSNGELRIASDVLHAFLMTKEYLHGVRSLESVVAMSTLARQKRFVSSSLPPEKQLALHVDLPFETPRPFHFPNDYAKLEKQAALAHEVFCRVKKKHGWQFD